LRRQILSRLAVLFLFLSASQPAWSQQTASIIGIVRVLRGVFPEPVVVTLQLRGAAIATTYTDGEGRFSFNSVAGSLYHVVINDDRYMPVDVEVFVRPDVLSMNMLQLTLVVRGGKSTQGTPGSEGYVVSLANLTKTYPKNAVKEFQRGLKLESEGKPEEAIQHYQKAIKDAPDFAVAHNNLGSVYVSKSQFPEAQKEFEESIRLAPSDSKGYFNMANLMLLVGKVEEGQRYLQDGFRKHPDSAFGLFVQGCILEQAGKLPEAERALRRALELSPKMTQPRLELVNVYLRGQQQADAISELQKFLQEAPTDPLAPRAREVLNKLHAATKPTSSNR
jgi:Flp pilus assembly protein TadD